MERDTNKQQFSYERRVKQNGALLTSSHITLNMDGTLAMLQSAEHTPDYSLKSFVSYQNQLGEVGRVQVEGDKVSFQLLQGITEKNNIEIAKSPVVVGPTLVGFILVNLEQLLRNKKIDFRFAVPERLETIGFSVEQIKSDISGQIKIKMSPSNFVIALAVKPLYFSFDAKSKQLVAFVGRVPPKVKINNAWKDFDASLQYEYFSDDYL